MPTENRSSNTEMVSVPFQREDRYIVIKRSDLKKVPVNYRSALVDPMFSLLAHLPNRECLVIESDWPEYEPAWAAIEARVTGKPALSASAEPSEPVERDERTEFEACIRREWPMAPISRKRDLLPKDDPCYGDYCDEPLQRAWVGWQMRAALERKPSVAPDNDQPCDLATWKRRAIEAESKLRTYDPQIVEMGERAMKTLLADPKPDEVVLMKCKLCDQLQADITARDEELDRVLTVITTARQKACLPREIETLLDSAIACRNS